MTHAELAVQVLQRAINADPSVDPAFKAAMDPKRVRFLEQTIREFCEFVIDSSAELGAGIDFHRAFDHLCQSINFDASAYRNEGFDREDV